MLCFRCEHRAEFLSSGRRPRFECGQIESSNIACYMYTPVRPVVLARLHSKEEDPRPSHGGYFGCRMKGVRVAHDETVMLKIQRINDEESVELWESVHGR